jgi:3-hydroxyisobutyrate dehydrogenase-like beta-hydroxyacid dehydrogenase
MTATLPRIGWVGLGKMGLPMARNVLSAGYPLAVFNRSPDKARILADEGAQAVGSLAALAGGVDIVVSMIADDPALRDVTVGPDGLYARLAPGAIHIDMSTVSPSASSEVAASAAGKGIRYLRAPVSGSTALAAAATLTIIASGDRVAFDQALPLLRVLGRTVHYVGPGEQARFLKLSINMMVGITAAMIGEALVLGETGEIDWRQSIDIINDSAVASPVLGYKKKMLQERDFRPAFTLSQMVKDFDLMIDTARRANLPLPLTAMVRNFMGAMIANGKGEEDFFAYVTFMEELAGITPPPAGGSSHSS